MSRHDRQPTRTRWLVAGAALVTLALVIAAIVRGTSGPAAAATPLEQARAALRSARTVSILGDSTGNDSNEWPALWTAGLARGRRVTLHQWDPAGHFRPDPVSAGSGPDLEVWNAALPGGAASWPLPHLAAAQPQRPDLTLLSFAHNNTAGDIGEQLDALRRTQPDPVVLVLQNPSRGAHQARQQATLAAAARWAADRGVATVDATAAFTDLDHQLVDDDHPNPAGSQAWAAAVTAALG